MQKIKLQLTKVYKNIILEESSSFFKNLPAGFSADDFYGPEVCGVPQPELQEDDDNRIDDAVYMTQIQLDKFLEKRAAGEPHTKADPILHSTVITRIKDENGNILDPEALGKEFSVRPDNILSKPNAKLDKTDGLIGSVNLPAYRGLIHDEYDDVIRGIITCPNAALCAPDCYARKASYVQFENTSMFQSRNLTFLMNDKKGWSSKLISEIEDKSYTKDRPIVRWHDSGDFFSPKYLQVALGIINATPDVFHYVYSKEVAQLKAAKIPENLLVTLSFGGKEDNLIDRKKDKHSDIVYPKHPKKIELNVEWQKYYIKKKINVGKPDESSIYIPIKDEIINLKKEIANKYGYPLKSILTNKELAITPVRRGAPYYVVIVAPKESDQSATRKDVLASLLIKH